MEGPQPVLYWPYVLLESLDSSVIDRKRYIKIVVPTVYNQGNNLIISANLNHVAYNKNESISKYIQEFGNLRKIWTITNEYLKTFQQQ